MNTEPATTGTGTGIRQRGAALIVGLVLLMALTVLAISTMRSSTMELTMAGNTRDREAAFNAAESGISAMLAAIRTNVVAIATVPGWCQGGPADNATAGTQRLSYATQVCYTGEVRDAPNSTVGAINQLHFRIISSATAGDRGAKAEHSLGVYQVSTAE